jgi:hypothetical protein
VLQLDGFAGRRDPWGTRRPAALNPIGVFNGVGVFKWLGPFNWHLPWPGTWTESAAGGVRPGVFHIASGPATFVSALWQS